MSDARKRMDTALDELAAYSNALYMAGNLPSVNQAALGEWIDFANTEIMSYARLLTQRGKKGKIENPDFEIPDIENPPAPDIPDTPDPQDPPETPDIDNPPPLPFLPDFE